MSNKIRYSLSIGKGLYDEITQLAEERHTSINTVILQALLYYQERDNHIDISQFKTRRLIDILTRYNN